MSKLSLKDKAQDSGEDVREAEAGSRVEDRQEPRATASGDDNADPTGKARAVNQRSISVRSLAYSGVVVFLAAAVGVLSWLYLGAQRELNAQALAAANDQRAEEVSLDYAVNAAQMNFKDFGGWKAKLINNTTPELNEKLSRAATDMEQVLEPLQWDSTARPLAAAVRSKAGGIYVVDTFVSVLTKTMQTPEGIQSTATYGITIDSNNDWQISDVGGIDAVLGAS